MMNSIFNLLTAPWTTHVVFTAIRLKLFTILAEKTKTVEEISSACGGIPEYLKALLDSCICMGLIILKNDKYLNSHFSTIYLVEGSPYYVGDLIDLQNEESKQWNKLYDMIVGKNHISTEQSEVNTNDKIFTKAMNNLGMLGEAEALKNSVNLSGCKKMIDVGGGSGLYSVVFCRENPNLRSTILDRAEVLASTKEMIADSKESTQITLRPADITKDTFGKNIDVVLISDLMYDESIAEPILKSAWNCLRKNGILIVRGYYSDPENSKPLFGSLFVLNLLVFNPNRTIMTISSLRKRVKERGFTIVKTSPLTERSIVLIAKK